MTLVLGEPLSSPAALCFASLTDAADKFDKKDFQTKATFELVVEKSKYLTPGTSEIASQSAFVSLAHGLIPENSDGLEINDSSPSRLQSQRCLTSRAMTLRN